MVWGWQERKGSLLEWGQFELGGRLVNLDFSFGGARTQLFLTLNLHPNQAWGVGRWYKIKLLCCTCATTKASWVCVPLSPSPS